jgi:hypothetical protein
VHGGSRRSAHVTYLDRSLAHSRLKGKGHAYPRALEEVFATTDVDVGRLALATLVGAKGLEREVLRVKVHKTTRRHF